ncbi:hypothetical protein DQ04_00411070 [Trypanosoma grayi]|uniref:hypothetical protein n=1 Tax=Trypanosoma grayi TaxID=71804 RepID=UPI0004F47820|nr:hypothetical protein DQ04_00411070 [Trypanosoma grayi]KEG14543.1 hypothetical protein DQ04_00411070 [Trypanosoma grayi]
MKLSLGSKRFKYLYHVVVSHCSNHTRALHVVVCRTLFEHCHIFDELDKGRGINGMGHARLHLQAHRPFIIEDGFVCYSAPAAKPKDQCREPFSLKSASRGWLTSFGS